MSIFDRARDALDKATPGPWEATTNEATMNDQSNWRIGDRMRPRVTESVMKSADAELIAASPELAAEVVRLHDELTALVDQWEAAYTANPKQVYESAQNDAAARIRQALEGDQQ